MSTVNSSIEKWQRADCNDFEMTNTSGPLLKSKENCEVRHSRPAHFSFASETFFSFKPDHFIIVLAICLLVWIPTVVSSDAFDDFPPAWEPLLWGGTISVPSSMSVYTEVLPSNKSGIEVSGTPQTTEDSPHFSDLSGVAQTFVPGTTANLGRTLIGSVGPSIVAPPDPPLFLKTEIESPGVYYRGSFRNITLRNIPPLYVTPELPGEGVWEWRGLPTDNNGRPLVYRTSYRPSEKYPNAIAHMLLFDMKRLSMKLYVGSAEPGASAGPSMIEPENKKQLVAITNALWKQKHSGEAGTITAGNVVKQLFPGVATLAIYQDGSVDIKEWSPADTTPSLVRDAKQLRHLIVKDGKVVNWVMNGGQPTDSEIGLGYLLSESEPMPGYQYWGGWWNPSYETTSGPDWFIATRSAFGVRSDGNLVFAIGHHISTKDLAKALVLAGCDRAIHGDANPHNVLGNLYFSDGNGNFKKVEKLSPDQKNYTLDRYVDRNYTSDFFGFFSKLD